MAHKPRRRARAEVRRQISKEHFVWNYAHQGKIIGGYTSRFAATFWTLRIIVVGDVARDNDTLVSTVIIDFGSTSSVVAIYNALGAGDI